MAPKSKPIPTQAWESHKAKISDLVDTHSLEDMSRFMREKYGFNATKKQYLRKLRSWGLAVSYIKKEDWKVIFHYLQALSSQGREFRVVQSGKPLSKSRLDRARRYLKDGSTTNPPDPSPEAGSHHLQNVVIQQKQADGEWALYKSFADENSTTAADTLLIPITQSEGNVLPEVITDSPNNLFLEAVSSFDHPFDDPLVNLFQHGDDHNMVDNGHSIFDEVVISPHALLLDRNAGPLDLVVSPGISKSWATVQEHYWRAVNPDQKPSICTILDFLKKSLQSQDYAAKASFFWSKLDGLPSTRFLTSPLIDRIPILRFPTDIPGALPTAWDRIQCLVQNVVAEVADNRAKKPSWRHHVIQDLLCDIRCKFPGLSLCNPEEVGNCQIQGGDVVETLFTRAVVFSMFNSLAGLDSYASDFIGSMMQRLHRYSSSLSVLSRLLNSNPEHLASSLVETLYRAALAVEDEHLLQWLLKLDKFTHIRETHVYKVFLVASKIRNGRLARFMLESGLVDISGIVERFLSSGPKYSVLLLCMGDVTLLREVLTTAFQLYTVYDLAGTIIRRHENRPGLHFTYGVADTVHMLDRHADLARILMQHDATIKPTLLVCLLTGDSTSDSFFKSLCGSTLEANHSALMKWSDYRDSFLLSKILLNLEDDHAAMFLTRFQDKCQATGCDRCLTDEAMVGHVLTDAVSRESCQLVQLLLQLLLPYATHSTLSKVLSIAIREGREEMVQLLLDVNIRYVSSLQLIGKFSYRTDQYTFHILKETTPLAEAIMTQNESLVAMIEGRGGLEELDRPCWDTLVTAAVATRNDNYVTKLLGLCPSKSSTPYEEPYEELYEDPDEGCLRSGLWLAVIQNRQSMFDMLLDGPAGMDGATTTGDMWSNLKAQTYDGYSWPLIMVAFETRNEHIVLRLLGDGDLDLEPGQERWLFQEAIRWGSRRVLEGLIRLSPGFRMESFSRGGRECKPRCLSCDREHPSTGKGSLIIEFSDKMLWGVAEQDIPGLAFLVKSGVMTTPALNDALQSAILEGDEYLFQTLLDLGAEPFADHFGMISLARAVRSPNANMLKSLLDKISPHDSKRHDIRIGALYGLQDAIAKGPGGTEALETLLKSDLLDPATLNTSFLPSIRIDRSYMTRPRTTILYHAIQACARGTNDDFLVLRKLLAAGSDVNRIVYEANRGSWPNDTRRPFNEEDDERYIWHPGFKNCTALVSAVHTGHRALVEMLLNHGANPNEEVGYGKKRTPLQAAAEKGSLPIVQLLLEREADVNARPAFHHGATAFQFAAISGNLAMAAELLRHGADLAQAPSRRGGRWPLEGAAEHGRISMIEYLCSICPDGFPESQWQSAIALAGRSGKHACKMFLEKLHSCFRATGSFGSLINADNLPKAVLD